MLGILRVSELITMFIDCFFFADSQFCSAIDEPSSSCACAERPMFIGGSSFSIGMYARSDRRYLIV